MMDVNPFVYRAVYMLRKIWVIIRDFLMFVIFGSLLSRQMHNIIVTHSCELWWSHTCWAVTVADVAGAVRCHARCCSQLLHHQLYHVCPLGSDVCITGRRASPTLCSVRLRLGHFWGIFLHTISLLTALALHSAYLFVYFSNYLLNASCTQCAVRKQRHELLVGTAW